MADNSPQPVEPGDYWGFLCPECKVPTFIATAYPGEQVDLTEQDYEQPCHACGQRRMYSPAELQRWSVYLKTP